jgi:hypothetical protein
MSAFTACRSSIARRAVVAALLVVLVLAQTLGWMHRGLHGSSAEAWRHGSPALSAAAADGARATGALQDLFSSHAEASDCRLFDVLGQPGCAPAAILALPALVPASFLALAHAEFIARWAALFDARGPPLPR